MRKQSALNTGIADLAGIALVVGVLGMPVPTAAITPGEVGEGIGKAVCYIVTLGVCIPILPPYTAFGTSTEPLPMSCTPARFTGPPSFFTTPIMTVKYQFHGSCSRADMPNAPALNYRLEGSWTPGVTNPNTPNASESLEITGYEPYLPDRAPGGRIFMYWTARCAREPWLSPEGGSCQNLRAFIPDDLRSSVTDLQPTTFPKSRIAIPVNERPQLYARYLHLTSPATTSANPFVKAPVPTPDMFTIVRPVWNDRVQQGQVVVKVTPPKVGMTPVTQLEFKWLDAPPNQPYAINHTRIMSPSIPTRCCKGILCRSRLREDTRVDGKYVRAPVAKPCRGPGVSLCNSSCS